MFERFNPDASRSLQVASSAASDRGDDAIGPDHLLLGLVDPTSGLAAELLAEAGIDEAAVTASMPDPPGRRGPSTPPFTGAAKKALELSLRESLNVAHAHIGSGHLLLGLLRLGAEGPALLPASSLTLDAARAAVRQRSEGPRLGGRRRPRRTGRIIEAATPHEQAKQAARLEGTRAALDEEEAAVRLATEEGSRLQRALASLGVSAEELHEALAEVAADPVDDGPVELHLGAGTTLVVAAGPRAADLRSLIAAADHVESAEGPAGTLRADMPALGDAVWATLAGWLTA